MKIIEKFVIAKYFFIYLGVTAIIGISMLKAYDAELFTFARSIPAVLTYVILMFSGCFFLAKLASIKSGPFSEKNTQNTVILIVLAVLVSTLSGVIGGYIWWIAGGDTFVNLSSALYGGGLIGLAVILMVLTGSSF